MDAGIHDLLLICIKQEKSLADISLDDMIAFSSIYHDDCLFLYKLLNMTDNEELEIQDDVHHISCFKENDSYIISFEERKLIFDALQLRKFMVILLDLFEITLPLGSVVDLKKKYFKSAIKVDRVDRFRMVITHRFLYSKGDSFFFPYGGIVYPIGTLFSQNIVSFTPMLIENVVHIGFSDEMEKEFVFAMKKELLGEYHMHSFGFAGQEDVERYQEKLRKSVAK